MLKVEKVYILSNFVCNNLILQNIVFCLLKGVRNMY